MKRFAPVLMLLLLTACGQEFKLNNDFGALTSDELLGLSRKTVSDVEETAATGDEATVTLIDQNPKEVCGIQNDAVAPRLSGQEREVVELLSREEAIQKMIQIAGELKERLKSENAPNIEELEVELQALREKLARLQEDPSYQAAFDRGREILKDRIDGIPSGARPILTEEQQNCLLTEGRQRICQDAVFARANGGALPNGLALPAQVQASLQRFYERHCEASN